MFINTYLHETIKPKKKNTSKSAKPINLHFWPWWTSLEYLVDRKYIVTQSSKSNCSNSINSNNNSNHITTNSINSNISSNRSSNNIIINSINSKSRSRSSTSNSSSSCNNNNNKSYSNSTRNWKKRMKLIPGGFSDSREWMFIWRIGPYLDKLE